MYKISTTALNDLTRFCYSIKLDKKNPSKEIIEKIINKFEPISNLNFKNLDIKTLEQKFEFTYIEFSREDDAYRHKTLGISIIVSLSNNYSEQLIYTLLDFVISSMNDINYTQILKLIFKTIFPDFKSDINRIIDNFIKNYHKI
jgi:hypothetical protein